jgi:SAM-dependent methyltransferase
MLDLAELAHHTNDMVMSGHRVFQIYRFAPTEKMHLARLLAWAELPFGASVIDMGCGVGEITRQWSLLRPDLSWYLVNISQAQLNYCPYVPQYCGDYCAVPQPDACCDAVLFCFSLGHADRAVALAEACRLLRTGGVLFIYDMILRHGNNSAMASVSYAVDSRTVMEEALAHAGFVPDVYLEPRADGVYGRGVLGKEFDRIFSGTAPAIWRWIKR